MYIYIYHIICYIHIYIYIDIVQHVFTTTSCRMQHIASATLACVYRENGSHVGRNHAGRGHVRVCLPAKVSANMVSAALSPSKQITTPRVYIYIYIYTYIIYIYVYKCIHTTTTTTTAAAATTTTIINERVAPGLPIRATPRLLGGRRPGEAGGWCQTGVR